MTRKRVIGGFLVAAALILFWRGCGEDPYSYRNFPPVATGDWVAFGDSLTSGHGAGDGNDYPSLLSELIGVNIRNFGVAGNTTQDGLNRIERALEMKPRVVLLCLGGNDGLRGIPQEQMFSNIATLIDHFHESGSFVVLIGIRSASLFDSNKKQFKQLAREKRVLYVPDILEGLFGRSELMADYIHPNNAGNRAIAERLAKILHPLLPELQ